MARATNDTMSVLHEKLAAGMLRALESQDEANALLAEFPDLPIPVRLFLESAGADNPALFTAVTKFLKDNQITTVIEDSKEMGELEKRLKAKRVRVDNVIPLEA